MQILRIAFCTIILSALALSCFSQVAPPVRQKGSRIIDDTTKQVYGPNTSRYYYEKDVFYNRDVIHSIDTFIKNYHRFNFVQRYNNLYQDLGNIGTSIRPIYYQTPEFIGVTSGFQSFDLYWTSIGVKYYDTKSAFTDMKVVLGGRGRSLTNISFSRNINPRWNIGFDFRSLLIDKQIQRSGKGDRNVKSTYYDLYTAYQSKDSTYRLFINFRRHHYAADENGGVRIGDNSSPLLSNSSFDRSLIPSFFYDNARPWLTDAESRERRINVHVYHQYNLFKKGIQLYHTFDSYRQANYFYDKMSDQLNKDYFDAVVVDSAAVKDTGKFKSLRNEVGVKGNLAKLFYNGYYAIRQYGMAYKYIGQDSAKILLNGTEHYFGGRMALQIDSVGEVNGWVEIQPLTNNFRIEGDIKSRWFEASIKQLQYSPGFLQQVYRGSHDEWNNNFDAVKATQINGYLHYRSRILTVSPGLTFTRLNDYVYFKKDTVNAQKVLPVQSKGTQVIASPELRLSLTMLRHITLSGQAIYSNVLQNDDGAIALPAMFVNGQLSYANIFFNGNMDMHGGVDVHWKSTYYAMGYDPVIQQFYRQNDFETPAFPIIDIFFSMKVKRGRIFLKYNNLIQAVTKSGYLPTPYYPGQHNTIDFGFNLFFFN